MRYKTRTLMLLPAVCAVGLVCNRIPVGAWSGARWVNLSVLVVDGSSGRPIPGASVELIHPIDDERPPVKGRTGANGRVVLRNLFYSGGVAYPIGGTEHVTFSPFVIRVTCDGFSEFCAALTPPLSGMAYERATDPPLNLKYPVTGPVEIPLTRSSGGRGKAAELPEG